MANRNVFETLNVETAAIRKARIINERMSHQVSATELSAQPLAYWRLLHNHTRTN